MVHTHAHTHARTQAPTFIPFGVRACVRTCVLLAVRDCIHASDQAWDEDRGLFAIGSYRIMIYQSVRLSSNMTSRRLSQLIEGRAISP